MRRRIAATLAAVVALAAVAALSVVVARRGAREDVPCGPGLVRSGPRCLVRGCPPPLFETAHGCDARPEVVEVPATTFTIGPSDWEAEGRVPARTVNVAPFAIDRFEVTVGQRCVECTDLARAASGITRDEARAFCKSRNGRLPTEDEWLAAAGPRRYPWGETGAVCRRAAWGLANGPCASGGTGPDTVGAHPDGVSLLGIHDLAGNVAEWVEHEPPLVYGGSWRSALATDLRIWRGRAVDPESRDDAVGFRCAYSR